MSQPMTREIPDPMSAALPMDGTVPEDIDDLFAEHHERVYKAAYRVTGNASDAEDVLQTIFLRLLRREDPPTLGPAAASYLHRAAVNAALDLLRSRRRARTSDVDVNVLEPRERLAQAPGPEAGIERAEMRDWLRSALVQLNPRAAEIFALRYFEGHGNTEIAEMLGTSRSSIAVTLHRTRNQLKKELASTGAPS